MANICPCCRHTGPERLCPRDGFPMVNPDRYESTGDKDDLTGQVFDGKYVIEARLGEGGMGTVWQARHIVMGHHVALKILRQSAHAGLTAVRRFYQEARSCSHLSHPNTIRVTDFGTTEDGLLYMAMELLQGQDLASALSAGGFVSIRRTLRIGQQICKSLAEAHAAGIVHRDLKPSNIFLARVYGESDFVKVIDFGISKAARDDNMDRLTSTGNIVGTPRYMSPEQVCGQDVDHRADLYSFGVLLYEMLCGHIPYDTEPENTPSAVLMAHVGQEPRPLPGTIRGVPVPDSLRVLVDSLLAKDPRDRPSSATSVAERFEAIERELLATPAPWPISRHATPRPRRSAPSMARHEPLASGTHDTEGWEDTEEAPYHYHLSMDAGLREAPPRALRHVHWTYGLAGAVVVLFVAVVFAVISFSGVAGGSSGGPAMAAPSPLVSFEVPRVSAQSLTPQTFVSGVAEGETAVPAPAKDGAAPQSIVEEPAVSAGQQTEQLSAPRDELLMPRPVPPESPSQKTPPAAKPSAAPASVEVRVTSVPDGAVVREGSAVLGQTPLVISVPHGQRRALSFERRGFVPRDLLLDAESGEVVSVSLRRLRRPAARSGAEPPSRGDQGPQPAALRLDYL